MAYEETWFEDKLYLVVSFLPLIHLIGLSFIKQQQNQYPQHLAIQDSFKIGFIYNIIIIQVITSTLYWIIEFKYHLEYTYIVNQQAHLNGSLQLVILPSFLIGQYLVFVFNSLFQNIINQAFTSNQIQQYILYFIQLLFACELVLYSLKIRKNEYSCRSCDIILLVKIFITLSLCFFTIMTDNFYVNKNKFLDTETLEQSQNEFNDQKQDEHVISLQKRDNLRDIKINSFREVQRFDKLTLTYIIQYKYCQFIVLSYMDKNLEVERSYREFIQLQKDLRVSQEQTLSILGMNKNNRNHLTTRDVQQRCTSLQKFIDSIQNQESNLHLQAFLNIDIVVDEYISSNLASQTPKTSSGSLNGKKSQNHTKTLPFVIWEDQNGEESKNSAIEEQRKSLQLFSLTNL